MQIYKYGKIKNLKNKKISILVEIAFFVLAIIFIIFIIFFGDDTLKFIKLKKTERDLQYFREILIKYKDNYKYLPGDDPYGQMRCPSYILVENGNGSKFIGDYENIDEEEQAIRHLRCMKILEGNPDEKYITYPTNSYGGIFKFSYVVLNNKKFNVIKIYKIPEKVMKNIDADLDDGDLNKGKIILIREKIGEKLEKVLTYIFDN